MTVSYRPLVPADQQFLWEMLYLAIFISTGQNPPPREVINRPELRRYAAGWGRLVDLGILAQDEDTPVGAAWLRLMHGYGFVSDEIPELSISILPGYRSKELGLV
jgi:hypothetical protein